MLQWIKCKGLPILIAVAGVIALFQTMSITEQSEKILVGVTNSFLSVWLCILSIVLYSKVWKRLNASGIREIIIAVLYSLMLSFALTAGKFLETVENLNVTDVKIGITIVILTVYFTPFVIETWRWIDGISALETEQGTRGKTWIDIVRYGSVLFICWLPVFLAFYPGAFVYDAYDEFIQVEQGVYTTHHPLLHVLLLGKAVMFGKSTWDSYNTGIAIYTIVQMLVLAGVLGYSVCFIKSKVKKSWIPVGVIIFYGFFPVIPMYAVCSSKDTLFTAAFLVVIMKMLQCLENTTRFFENKGNVAVSVVAAVLMMLLRNNGMYVYGAWIPIIIIFLFVIKKEKKDIIKITFVMVSALVIFACFSKLLITVTNADTSESQEIMTVPIQQMARTYKYSPETYSEEEKEILFEILPEEEMHLYNARLSDLLKSKFNNEKFNQDKGKYLRLWINIGMRKPMIYLNAWFMTSYGYWYPDTIINVYGGNGVHTFTYQDSSYFGFETEPPGTRESKFPWLEEQYRQLSLELYQQKVPGVSMLFSPGFLFWIFSFCVCYLLQKGKWKRIIPLLGILLLWGTAILGPTYLVRYVLILWFAMPVVLIETVRE